LVARNGSGDDFLSGITRLGMTLLSWTTFGLHQEMLVERVEDLDIKVAKPALSCGLLKQRFSLAGLWRLVLKGADGFGFYRSPQEEPSSD
jgi:hypothetical protein